MILPGTLVQCIKVEDFPDLFRVGGIYTVRSYSPGPFSCDACTSMHAGISLEEVRSPHYAGWSVCCFRILAPPITEADRLEMTEPAPTLPVQQPVEAVPGIAK